MSKPYAAAVAVLVALAACGGSKGDPLVRASVKAVADDTRFVSANGAAQTYADVSATLLKASKRCRAGRRAGDSRCTARASAAGFFRVLAVQVIACDRDDRQRSRDVARAALDIVLDADRSHGKERARQPPALPRCTASAD